MCGVGNFSPAMHVQPSPSQPCFPCLRRGRRGWVEVSSRVRKPVLVGPTPPTRCPSPPHAAATCCAGPLSQVLPRHSQPRPSLAGIGLFRRQVDVPGAGGGCPSLAHLRFRETLGARAANGGRALHGEGGAAVEEAVAGARHLQLGKGRGGAAAAAALPCEPRPWPGGG